MSPGMWLWLALVIVSAYAASRINTTTPPPCDWHVWEYKEGVYRCTKCELIAGWDDSEL